MPLWNELEGTRVADKFPLKQLMRSEGRIAWFATEDTNGQPAVISLLESLNDEEAVLARMEAAAYRGRGRTNTMPHMSRIAL